MKRNDNNENSSEPERSCRKWLSRSAQAGRQTRRELLCWRSQPTRSSSADAAALETDRSGSVSQRLSIFLHANLLFIQLVMLISSSIIELIPRKLRILFRRIGYTFLEWCHWIVLQLSLQENASKASFILKVIFYFLSHFFRLICSCQQFS